MFRSYSLRAATAAALACFLVALGAAALSTEAAAANGLSWIKHRGVNLMALDPVAGASFDVEIVGRSKALSKLRAALDTLLDRSPLSAAAIGKLKLKGDVFIVYDPRYPKKPSPDILGAQLAEFRTDLFDNAAELTDGIAFAVVIGRYLVKWPSDEVAAMLAQEIVGHGMQHREGRFETMNEQDARCEAGLYREKAHQDFGFNKRAALHVKFRQALEWRWCSNFKRYMKARAPERMALWKTLNPDVPALLAVFADYMVEGPVVPVVMAPVPEPKPVSAMPSEPVAPPVVVAVSPAPETVAPVAVAPVVETTVASPATEEPATEDHLASLFDDLAKFFGASDGAATEAAATPVAASDASDDEIAAWIGEIASLFAPDEAPANAPNLPVSQR